MECRKEMSDTASVGRNPDIDLLKFTPFNVDLRAIDDSLFGDSKP